MQYSQRAINAIIILHNHVTRKNHLSNDVIMLIKICGRQNFHLLCVQAPPSLTISVGGKGLESTSR